MALEIVKLYIELISQYFTLSDPAVRSSPKQKQLADPILGTTASFVPMGTTSLTASHFLTKMVSEIAECVHDVVSAEISSEATFGLDTLLVSARWRFEDVLCDLWNRGGPFTKARGSGRTDTRDALDAIILNRMETWDANLEIPNTTIYLSRIHKFQKHNTTGAYKIATIAGTSAESTSGRSLKKPIASEFTTKITKGFIDCLYAILDGFVPLAMGELPQREVNVQGESGKVVDLKDTVRAPFVVIWLGI